MASLLTSSCPGVYDMGTRNDKMAGEDSPTSMHGDISKSTTAPKDTRDSGQVENEATTDTNVTQPEPAKPDERKIIEAPDSPTIDELTSTNEAAPLPDEAIEANAANNATDISRTASPAPTDDYPPLNLYRQYLEMVKRISAGETGESLLTGVIDYMKVVDERLCTIEGKLRRNEEEEQHTSVTGVSSPPSEAGDFGHEDILNEVKFFEAEVEDFNSHGDLVDMATDHGRFSSPKDHPQVLRALYNKLSDDMTIDKTSPEPEKIDLVYLSILSEPIASFFRDVLSLDCGQGYCIRLSKPFRPLIKNMKPFKDHLANLEKAYGYGNLSLEGLDDR